MFTIEEDSGTFTGSLRRHNGYYAGDFTRNPVAAASELSASVLLRSPTFPLKSGRADRPLGHRSGANASVTRTTR